MAPPMRSHQNRHAPAAETPDSGSYMAFSMSLMLAYQHAALSPAQVSPLPRAHHKRSNGARAPQPLATAAAPFSKEAPRVPPSAKTIAPSIRQALPPTAARDATWTRLSAEAQLIQDQARVTYQLRLSALSDRESLRCLESLSSHVHSSPVATDRPVSRPTLQPLLLPKYFPSSPSRRRSPRGASDHSAPPTTQRISSSGQSLHSVRDFGHSFSDDAGLSEDDDFFLSSDRSIGGRLLAGGISLFARLQEVKFREARRGSTLSSSASASLPGMSCAESMKGPAADHDGEEEEEEEEEEVSNRLKKAEQKDIEDWLHVLDSSVLKRGNEQGIDHGALKKEIAPEEEVVAREGESINNAVAIDGKMSKTHKEDGAEIGNAEDMQLAADDPSINRIMHDSDSNYGMSMSSPSISNLMIEERSNVEEDEDWLEIPSSSSSSSSSSSGMIAREEMKK